MTLSWMSVALVAIFIAGAIGCAIVGQPHLATLLVGAAIGAFLPNPLTDRPKLPRSRGDDENAS